MSRDCAPVIVTKKTRVRKEIINFMAAGIEIGCSI
jgi:hypothetical protein